MVPVARQTRMLTVDVGDEVVVYDQDGHQAHRLNRTAALIWRACDGRTDVPALAAGLEHLLRVPIDADVVRLGLDQLAKAGLLQEPPEAPAAAVLVTRRALLRKLGQVGTVALLLPVVSSLVVPTAAMAQSRPPKPPKPPKP